MQITREELIRTYGGIFVRFDFAQPLSFVYGGESYDLTEPDALEALMLRAKADGDYMVSKIANNVLAVYETEHQVERYRHLPVMMHIELSSYCNCECIMCKHCYERNNEAKYLPWEKFDELEQYFATCKIVIINGYGEPLIHPQISRIIDTFARYQVKMFTTTNLQSLPVDNLAQINQVFARLNISCDGAKAATYESIRRGASFATFVENVRTLRQHCPAVPLYMSVVAMRQNIEEAVELVRLAKELGFEEIRFGRLGSNLLLGNEKDELIYYPNFAAYMLEKAKRGGERLGVRVVIPVILKDSAIDEEALVREQEALHQLPFYHGEEHYEALRKAYLQLKAQHKFDHHLYTTEGAISCQGLCHWIGFGLYINCSGKVRPCSEIPYNREQEKREERIDYNYEELVEFRRQFIAGRVPRGCMDCAFIMSDEIGCLQVNMQEYKQYFKDKAGLTDRP